jgi:hypothetical protein
VHFAFTEEQTLIHDTARAFCAERGDVAAARGVESPLERQATWRDRRGAGLVRNAPPRTSADGPGRRAAILCEQMGRVLPSPLRPLRSRRPRRALAATAQRERCCPASRRPHPRHLAIANEHGAPGLDGIGHARRRSLAGGSVRRIRDSRRCGRPRRRGHEPRAAAHGRRESGRCARYASVSIKRSVLDQTRPMSRFKPRRLPRSDSGEPGEAGPAS